ncbi:enolase C-terminal domain-like protein [Bosea sp. (in: a-proteobacteria)]|uniref:enolase C-terminal domain-like protein n=1 Tax=Bosea sp. (in: a-proteobacteria) TaxID=1871050 RepID=UPI0026199FD4|nr:enolase C-terminal domain-like protein [Bosea sp. (in: a-proteobacteria)]MCO5090341.1 mandelate racemase [Bosea sp. (in: a-proteobacteria)]
MNKIRAIDVYEFKFDVNDLGYDHNRAAIYKPGQTGKISKLAISIETESGSRGEYVSTWASPVLAIRQTHALAALLIGEDADARELIYDRCKRTLRKFDHIGYGVIDICLWDLAGKECNASISKMLGRYRSDLPAYASTTQGDPNGGLGSPEQYADFAEECLGYGYRGYKIHQHSADPREEAATITAVAQRVGGRMALMSDPSSEFMTLADAIYVGKACDEAEFLWYEDPYADCGTSAFGNRKLKEFVKTPLLITEHLRGVEPKADFVLAGGTDIVRADPEIDMGITGTMKIAHMAEALGLDVEVHGAGPAHRQAVASIRNTNFYELGLVHPKAGNPMTPPVYSCGYSDALTAVRSDGTFPVPEGPGLGVSYDWAFIEANTLEHRRFDASTI